MKYLLAITTFFFSIVFVSSCTKCVKCLEKTTGDTLIVEYPETCGNWRDVAFFEKRVHEQALNESDVVCTQKSKIPLLSGD